MAVDSSPSSAAQRDPGPAAQREPNSAPTDESGATVVRAPAPVPEDKTVISKRPPISLSGSPFAAPPHDLGSTLVGKRLEHYELVAFVGGGGMGAVFRATDTRLGRPVAVKVLSGDQGDEETIRRFRNEAQSAARLDHPNIARVYYVGEDQGLNFIVFEFIEGTNLRDDVEQNGPLELEQALHYTLQVAEALEHASSRDVIHRDIKPSNVLVTESGQVKLVDMGLARMHAVEASADDLTASGVTLGTFDYISPEQARDPRATDVRSDIYSLGCTLYFMLTGQPPFPEGTALQKLLQHNSDAPQDVRHFRPELSPRVATLLAKMLAKRPSQRHQSAAELIADIVSLGNQLGLARVADYGRAALRPLNTSSQWKDKAWQAMGAVALLAILIVGMEVLSTPTQSTHGMVMQPKFKKQEAVTGKTTFSVQSSNGQDQRSGQELQTAAIGPALESTQSTAANGSTPEVIPAPPSPPRHDLPSNSPPVAASTRDFADAHWVKTIAVLGDAPAPPAPQTEYFITLAEACARAAEIGLSEVQLHFSGRKIEQPLEINNQRIAIRATDGFRPILVFRPQARSTERHMIRLTGGSAAHLQVEGVEFRLELPTDLPEDGWSLMELSTGQAVELAGCVLTVQDGDEDRLPIHDQVAMISVQRRRPNETMTVADMQLAMGQQARLNLERTIVRGEASLVTMLDETPLTIRWNQGLLVTSRHLIETAGSASEPQYYEQIAIDFDHVTAYARQGLYYLRRGPGKPYQFYVSAHADQCVIVSDPGSALFEMCGLGSPPEEDELQWTGNGNRFSPAEIPFLLVRSSLAGEPQAFRLGRRWSTETRSQAGVPWLQAPPLHRPAHQATKDDFLVDVDSDLDEGAGFDPLVLPEIESVATPTDQRGLQRQN